MALSSAPPTVAPMKEVPMRTMVLAAALLLVASACGGDGSGTTVTGTAPLSLPQDGKPFPLDPNELTTDIDNPWWPMKPGSRWVFRETDAEGTVSRVVVTVLDETKTIMGAQARVVHDQVTEDGEVKEDTFDWYAQDAGGNLWYLGEDTTEYENGKPKTKEGSWEAGVEGALPGIIMPADPQVGMAYREEYYKGHAEDAAAIISTDALAVVPFGRFEHGVQTRNTSSIEPDVVEEKVYAKGVGVVLEITVSGGSDRSELLSYSP
jgi:hypothetical protein